MKILHIAKIKNDKTNGVNVVVPQHIFWQARGNEVAFINYNGIIIDGLEEYQLEYNKSDVLQPVVSRMGGAPDLVIFHEVNNIDNIDVYKQVLKNRVPYIIIPHGELTRQALKKKWLKKRIAYFLWFNRFIKKSQAIQCLSKHEAENIKFKQNKFVGTNGIVDSQVKKVTFNTDRINFVYIGRLDSLHKGIDLMLQAFASKRELLNSVNARLDIYGPDVGNRVAIIRDLIKEYDLGEFVCLHDPVLGEDKTKVLLDSDIFIQTSRFEGMPVGLLEAINMGLPAIYTDGTNLREFDVYDFGYDAGSTARTIGNAIEAAICDRDNWGNKGANGIKMTLDNFEWGKVSSVNVEVYKKLIGEN